MSEDLVLKCLICFVLGYLVSRMMRGNGLMVGGFGGLSVSDWECKHGAQLITEDDVPDSLEWEKYNRL